MYSCENTRYERLKLAQLLGQLGVFLTCAASDAVAARSAAKDARTARGQPGTIFSLNKQTNDPVRRGMYAACRYLQSASPTWPS